MQTLQIHRSRQRTNHMRYQLRYCGHELMTSRQGQLLILRKLDLIAAGSIQGPALDNVLAYAGRQNAGALDFPATSRTLAKALA